jgi:phosphoribosylformylglycinamidine synthase subunit PurQ / glutaminase
MTARIGVVTFPGSLDDHDAARAVRRAGGVPVPLWHAEPDLHGVDAVVLPGGFSYGDYLRAGAIARFAPIMSELVPAAGAGLPVLGICNGFQILCEAHLLPGALTRNRELRFISREVRVRVENAATPWTRGYAPGQEVTLVLKSGEGWKPLAWSWPATPGATRTARPLTSPGYAARTATWPGSCPIPSTRSTP